jgi:hypothetical protein
MFASFAVSPASLILVSRMILSLTDLARELGDKVNDWAFVENDLIENGIWYLAD